MLPHSADCPDCAAAEARGFADGTTGHDPDPPYGRPHDRRAYRRGYASGRRFFLHRRTDPHCTCNDCIEYHAHQLEG